MTLWRRVVGEKRALVIPLALAILVNVAVYGLVVYPLGVKSARARRSRNWRPFSTKFCRPTSPPRGGSPTRRCRPWRARLT